MGEQSSIGDFSREGPEAGTGMQNPFPDSRRDGLTKYKLLANWRMQMGAAMALRTAA
jgi:hypothetical protein